MVVNDRLRTLAVEHVDPHKVELALELGRRYPESPDAQQGPPHVLRTGKSELASEISEERLAELATDDFHLGLVRELGFQSYMCVPLAVHGRVRSEEHTSELQSRPHLVCRLLLEKKKNNN